MAATINILVSTISGLELPPTLAIPVSESLPISSFTEILAERLPFNASRLSLRTTSGTRIDCASPHQISTLTRHKINHNDNNTNHDVHAPDGFLSLHLTSGLLGGKGGFGSQLRAAGGRMSSRKDRNSGEANGSNRNLDGRRLRTVAEAKNLAEYLATKPEMDRREKEERRKRWEAIIEAAERREEEIRSGKRGQRLDGQWVERKEEEESKTRDAIVAMMKQGEQIEGKTGSESENEMDHSDSSEAQASGSASSSSGRSNANGSGQRDIFGWDENDLSEDEEDGDANDNEGNVRDVLYLMDATTDVGKGKGKAPVEF